MSERYPNRWRGRGRGGRGREDYRDNRRQEFDRSYSTYPTVRGSRDGSSENLTGYRDDNWEGGKMNDQDREKGVSAFGDRRSWRSGNYDRYDFKDRGERQEKGDEAQSGIRPYISQQRNSYTRRGGYYRPSYGQRGMMGFNDNYRKGAPMKEAVGNKTSIRGSNENHWVTRLNLKGEMRKDISRLFERLESINKSLQKESSRKIIAEAEVEKYNRFARSENLKCQLMEERLETFDLA